VEWLKVLALSLNPNTEKKKKRNPYVAQAGLKLTVLLL
jgi:hypothetical protein